MIEEVEVKYRKPSQRLKQRLKIGPGRKFKAKSGKSTKKPSKKLLRAHKPKKFKKDLWAEFNLPMPAYVRYSGLQGILWHVMSQYVRKSEWIQYGGECVDGCPVLIQNWYEADCGHFRSAKSLSTRFLRENLGLQRKYCNSPHGCNGRQYDFGKTVDQRYGAGTADRLTNLAEQVSRPLPKELLISEIRRYQALFAKLPD